MPISLLVLEVKFIDQRTDGRTRLPFMGLFHALRSKNAKKKKTGKWHGSSPHGTQLYRVAERYQTKSVADVETIERRRTQYNGALPGKFLTHLLGTEPGSTR
jgi:hypothetical protein